MGSFSWIRAEHTTDRANIVVGDEYKILVPEEFGGGYIRDFYRGYGRIFDWKGHNQGCEYVDGQGNHFPAEDFPVNDLYGILAYWNIGYGMDFTGDKRPESIYEILKNGNTLTDSNRTRGISIGCYDKQIDKLKYPLKLVSASYDMTYEQCAGKSYGDPEQGFEAYNWDDIAFSFGYDEYLERLKTLESDAEANNPTASWYLDEHGVFMDEYKYRIDAYSAIESNDFLIGVCDYKDEAMDIAIRAMKKELNLTESQRKREGRPVIDRIYISDIKWGEKKYYIEADTLDEGSVKTVDMSKYTFDCQGNLSQYTTPLLFDVPTYIADIYIALDDVYSIRMSLDVSGGKLVYLLDENGGKGPSFSQASKYPDKLIEAIKNGQEEKDYGCERKNSFRINYEITEGHDMYSREYPIVSASKDCELDIASLTPAELEKKLRTTAEEIFKCHMEERNKKANKPKDIDL